MKTTIVWEGPAALGEGPLWHVEEQLLYWIDIAKPAIHCLNPVTQHHQTWPMPAVIGALAPCTTGGLIAAVGPDVVHFDPHTATLTPLKRVIPESKPYLRMNDGKCDRRGRFWVGVAHCTTTNPEGGLFRLDPDGTLTEMLSQVTISNGLGFSPNDTCFYYTDGLRYRINQYDFDLATGTLHNPRPFVQLPKSPIEPDGLTVDREGFVWAAQWNAGQIVRFAPDGSIDQHIALPVARPTSLTFGGPNLDILYVTSCSQGMGEPNRLAPPAGAVFAIQTNTQGLPEPGFNRQI